MKLNITFLAALLLAPPAALYAADVPEQSTEPLAAAGDPSVSAGLATAFANPPTSARPWVYWFWINGNISKEGITADLEALQRAGVGGVLWMEVSGPWWAPQGRVAALSPEWHEAFQWAVRECDRLGLEFDVSVDFGYGSGGPHITPELSMQKLYWSEAEVEGGQKVDLVLPKPEVVKKLSAWLRPGAEISATVREQIENVDSYKDVAVVAIPVPASRQARAYRLPQIMLKTGTDWRLPRSREAASPPPDCVIPPERVVDLTGRMGPDGRLRWDPPPGKWLLLRYGHASNFKMTRPCPAAAVGLECDRLSKAGIEAHYAAFLKRIFEGAGPAAGRTLAYVHIDSWEAGGQNWTATFPAEFEARRGYDLRRWLPVLTGRVVGSAELSERFLWDVRTTVSEMIRDNYAGRLRELARTHGIKLSIEAYGHLCIDNLAYAGASDMPISEFWARGEGLFPGPGGYEASTKVMASAAHTYGKPVVAAEAFTSDRGWRDHPFLLKAMGDRKFCEGLNRMIFHLSAHQPYENMVPGLTHRRWGEHFHRHNTWWDYGRPWMDYLSRCQYLLQQGEFVADVCYWPGEGAPLSVNDLKLEMPKGYDFDFCSSEVVLRMRVKEGRVVLPSGASYRYLLLPASDRMTPPLARKIRELVDAGGRVIAQERPRAAPGLTDFPGCDAEIETIAAALWDADRVVSGKSPADVFIEDRLQPDFEGADVEYIHRRVGEADVYFVSHQENRPLDARCTFRVAGKQPELWDPESGAIRELPEFTENDGRMTVPLRFEPMQSWFVVFRKSGPLAPPDAGTKNFQSPGEGTKVAGPWQVSFDPRWGGPDKPVAFDELADWSKHADPRIHYYSGTAVYRKSITLTAADVPEGNGRLFLDLGAVEVMARVKLNGKGCGVAWKPPYRLDITDAVRAGSNDLEIAVVNLWINRMIGDEQLPLDGNWKDFETLLEWPDWFTTGEPRPSGRYAFSSCRHYQKDSPLVPSGLLGPVTLRGAGLSRPKKQLPLPGEVFSVAGRTAFVIPGKTAAGDKAKPWVWYAPTLPGLPSEAERWMFEKFHEAGIAVAGIDVGESYGSPAGRRIFSALYAEMTGPRGYSRKPVLLGRSRGGLMALSWAAENADKVGGFAGIYPVCNVASYPGVAKAASAYEMKPEALQARLGEHNPVDRLAGLAKAGVPLFAIHGDSDKVVPLEANSALLKTRYTALGGRIDLIVPAGQGHNMWPGFFQSEELVHFVTTCAKP